MKLTQEILKELLDYDANTGILTWKLREEKWFPHTSEQRNSKWHMAHWNAQFAGKKALEKRESNGYKRGGILGKTYSAHRVIWLWMTGEWPDQVDHKNGKRSDNRWDNLRNVSASINMRNQKRHKTNKSGWQGVIWIDSRKRWRVIFNHVEKKVTIGHYKCLGEAIKIRKEHETLFGYHENSGRR